MSNDLFDLVYSIFVNDDIAVDKTKIVTTFLRKTIFEPSPQAALRLLLAVPFEVMRGYWSTIICAAESRMDFTMAVDRFKGELRSLFSSFRYGDANQLAFFPAELRTPIMQAGRSQTLLRITYDGVPRMVEPYALSFKWRKDGAGQEYLYVWDRTGGAQVRGERACSTGRSHRWRIPRSSSNHALRSNWPRPVSMASAPRSPPVVPACHARLGNARGRSPVTGYAAPTASANSTGPAQPP